MTDIMTRKMLAMTKTLEETAVHPDIKLTRNQTSYNINSTNTNLKTLAFFLLLPPNMMSVNKIAKHAPGMSQLVFTPWERVHPPARFFLRQASASHCEAKALSWLAETQRISNPKTGHSSTCMSPQSSLMLFVLLQHLIQLLLSLPLHWAIGAGP